MNYLVTGGTGLIGSRIVRDLVREGAQVVVYDLRPDVNMLRDLLSDEEIGDRVVIVQGDVTDVSNFFRAIIKNKVEAIIHTASLLVLDSNANPPLAVKVNCEGTLCVLEAVRTLELKKVVWASSNSVFGPPEMYPVGHIPNDAPHYPQNIYGATKSFNEAAAAYYFREHGVDVTGIRYMHVYGGGSHRGFFATIIQELVVNPALGKPGRVPHGDALIGWSYADDPARATVMASKVPMTKTRCYSIRGDVRPVREVADYVRTLLPSADITILPGSFTGDPVKLDTTLVETEIGFRPEWSMERGIREAINTTRRAHGGLAPV
jgi:nucleoside-diphosphate-sugar epimerase